MIQTLHHPQDIVNWLRARMAGAGTLQTDSRQVRPGDAFIAWPGAATDGRRHVADARVRGAVACLVEAEGLDAFGLDGDDLCAIPGLKAATGLIAALWFDQPSQQLDVLAVTGTNGKTSTTWWLAHALNLLLKNERVPRVECGLVGTLGIGVLSALEDTGLTTPDPVRLQRCFRQLRDQGLGACAIEASSIGLAEHRLAGTRIRTAVFTNFTQDHLDYHASMGAYWQAKRALFDWPGLQAAVVNVDDPAGAELHAELQGRGLDLWSVSAQGPARLMAQDIRWTDQGLGCTVVEGDERLPLATTLVGDFNLLNLLGVIATLRTLGISLTQAMAACAQLAPMPGRMECLATPGQPLVVVDYAHTPDALDKALRALRPLAQARGGELGCVFGCGGDRDAGKRPLMGAAVERLADRVIVTDDNPRSEDPAQILHQILQGTIAGETVRVEPDRAAAIALAVADADPADVLLIAGKGHEPYQEIAGVRRPFSDQACAQQVLQARATAQPSSASAP